MILKALTLENFKGIREPVRIEFAPLTLLFGPNNAGKSTVVQALMYAREVLERNNCDVGRTQMGGMWSTLVVFAIWCITSSRIETSGCVLSWT